METRRLLWLIALFFSLVLLLQYIQLPYSYVLSSLFSSWGSSNSTIDSKYVFNPTIVKNTSPSKSFFSRASSNDTGNLDNETDIEGRIDDEHDLEVETDKPSSDPSGSFVYRSSFNGTIDSDNDLNPTSAKNRKALHDLELETDNDTIVLDNEFSPTDVKNRTGMHSLELGEDKLSSDMEFNPNDIKNRTNMHDLELEMDKPSSDSSGSFLSRNSPNTTVDSDIELDPTNVNNRTHEHNFNPVSNKSSTNASGVSHTVEPSYPRTNHSSIDMTASAGNETYQMSPQKGVMKRHGQAKGKDPTDAILNISSVITSSSHKRRWVKGPPSIVVPISKMSNMLRKNVASYQPAKPEWSSPADDELRKAKMLIQNAKIVEKTSQDVDVKVYRSYSTFIRSYELMEKTLKVYVYSEGERPIFHQPLLNGIYASEGWFMNHLEGNKHFVTKNATNAHLFYLPYSSQQLKEKLYVKDSHNRKNMVAYLSHYVRTISTKYSFWNRTSGADHFLVACHDWGPAETRRIMKNCIRALCNADVRGGLQFGKDVSLPEIYVRDSLNPLKDRGGKSPSQRRILAFFAGNMHGYLRPILLDHWQDKDPEMKIFGKLRPRRGQMTYVQYMKSSKYCISAKGYEAYTPRVVEAIFYECVPVIVSDNYVPPFFETLNWEAFAVFVLEKDIPNLKRILKSIPEERYRVMQERVRKVQRHFLWNKTPVKYDVFHMILHSIWYTRVFQMRQ